MGKLNNRVIKVGLLTLVFALGCKKGFKPVDILPGDVCSLCKMHITEKKFAAEYITKNRTVKKFDDIGCMVESYLKEKEKVAVIYVVDFETGEWIKAQDAVFVRGFTTPMNWGFAAFKKGKRDGLSFEEIVKIVEEELEKEK